MMRWFKENTVQIGSKKKSEHPELIERGIFVEKEHPEYVESYMGMVSE